MLVAKHDAEIDVFHWFHGRPVAGIEREDEVENEWK